MTKYNIYPCDKMYNGYNQKARLYCTSVNILGVPAQTRTSHSNRNIIYKNQVILCTIPEDQFENNFFFQFLIYQVF